MNTSQADILVYGKSSQPLAIVEVKNLRQLSTAHAIEVRRALIDDGLGHSAESYLLVVSQEFGYLWEPTRSTVDADARPDARFAMRDVLGDYLSDSDLDGHLRGAELELAVTQWLWDLSRGQGRLPSDDAAVARLGVDIRGARVEGGPRS